MHLVVAHLLSMSISVIFCLLQTSNICYDSNIDLGRPIVCNLYTIYFTDINEQQMWEL